MFYHSYISAVSLVKFTKRRNRIEEFLQTLSDGDSFGVCQLHGSQCSATNAVYFTALRSIIQEVSFNSDKTTSTCIAKDQVELLVISKSVS